MRVGIQAVEFWANLDPARVWGEVWVTGAISYGAGKALDVPFNPVSQGEVESMRC